MGPFSLSSFCLADPGTLMSIVKRLGVFMLGPLTIIAVLKIVSGDDHIHVAAPTLAAQRIVHNGPRPVKE